MQRGGSLLAECSPNLIKGIQEYQEFSEMKDS